MFSKDTNYSKNQPFLNSFLFLTFAVPKAVLWGFPSPFRPSGRTNPPPRRGVRVVEGARLESVYTGNCIAGSNPALSAKTPENQRNALVFLCLFGNEACFGERKRHKKHRPPKVGWFSGVLKPPPRHGITRPKGRVIPPFSVQMSLVT